MDSPSAQLLEESLIFNGPPSSPFVAEMEVHSRSASTQHGHSHGESNMNVQTPSRSSHSPQKLDWDIVEDKENATQQDPTLAKLFASPMRQRGSPKQQLQEPENKVPAANDIDLMPPPSVRKVSTSPTKTPLRASRNGACTPKSLSRDRHRERPTPSRQMSDMSHQSDDFGGVDDTCFSTFSEIPDMTTFAKLHHSPAKRSMFSTPGADLDSTPRVSRKRASHSRSPSPTPRSRRQKTPSAHAMQDGTTSFLIDFTQQMDGVTRSGSPPKSATESNLLQFIANQRTPNKAPRQSYAGGATPVKQSSLLNLLDFELPPAPTPRSVPTITVRELESLKSSYLSQISSLKATLSGREAEVESLKKAIGDAERRAGEAQETLREEKCRREQVEEEKQSWEKRGLEVEQVLRNVKEEVIKGEVEKEDMMHRLEDAEKRIEDAEARATKAEERFADALASRGGGSVDDVAATEEKVQKLVAMQIDAKIEAVSRELHAVYKEKHERKVATLKKSYEARAEKKMAELQSRVADLDRENHELQLSKDATFTGLVADASPLSPDMGELKAQLEEQKAHLARLQTEMEASRSQQAQLEQELQQERIEKGDLVAAVDEMLALQSEQPAPPGPKNAMQGALDMVQDFRQSISRPPAGLRAPAAAGSAVAESRIGRGIPTGLSMPKSVPGVGVGKSKMLANIERMGRTGSKDGANAGS